MLYLTGLYRVLQINPDIMTDPINTHTVRTPITLEHFSMWDRELPLRMRLDSARNGVAAAAVLV